MLAPPPKGPGERGRASGDALHEFFARALSVALVLNIGYGHGRLYYTAPRQALGPKDFQIPYRRHHAETALHYTTVGGALGPAGAGAAGSGGSAASMLTPTFAGELFGPGQPLDAAKYYIIIPDASPRQILETVRRHEDRVSKYDYADMVDAQYRLVS